VLIGTGGLLAFTGVLLLSSTVDSATRQWVNQLQQPPSEFAKLKWRQARTATAAGAKAWRSGAPTQSTSSMLGTSDSQRRSDDRISQSNERERHGHWTGTAHRLGLQPPQLPR
jgi:hypothetical protein